MHFCAFLGTDCDVSSQEHDCSDDADVLLEEVTGLRCHQSLWVDGSSSLKMEKEGAVGFGVAYL